MLAITALLASLWAAPAGGQPPAQVPLPLPLPVATPPALAAANATGGGKLVFCVANYSPVPLAICSNATATASGEARILP